MPLSRPWIPLSRFSRSFRIAITLRCSDLILSCHPFLCSSYLYRQRILTKILRNISCKLLPGKNKFFLRKTEGNQLSIKVLLKMEDTEQYVEAKALIDSGCTGCAINREFINKHKIKREKLTCQLRVLNADGSENSSGRITHHTEIMMRMGKIHWEKMDFGITKLDDHDIFLGFDWLMEHNPEINWKTGGIRFS